MGTSKDDVFDAIKSIMVDVFDANPDEITQGTNAADIEEWDSLSHIRLMVAIEKKFKIKFKNSEIESLANVGDLVRLVQEKLG